MVTECFGTSSWNNCGMSMGKVFTRLGIWAALIPIWSVPPRTSTIEPNTVGVTFAGCAEDCNADRLATCAKQSWGSANKSARLRAGINSAVLIDLYSLRRNARNMASHAYSLDGCQ